MYALSRAVCTFSRLQEVHDLIIYTLFKTNNDGESFGTCLKFLWKFPVNNDDQITAMLIMFNYFILLFLSSMFSNPFCVYLMNGNGRKQSITYTNEIFKLAIWSPCFSGLGKSHHMLSSRIRKCLAYRCWALVI
jgi:hypothetical protein